MEAWSLYQYGKEIRALRALAREAAMIDLEIRLVKLLPRGRR
jgi:hypothetical protein